VMTPNDPKTSTTIANAGYDSTAPFRAWLASKR
jgi:hypothetical protein